MGRHVRKGDTVIVNSGDHKGSVGEIIAVDTKKSTVTVKGVDMHVRHMKPNRTNQTGGIVRRETPMHVSKVNPVVEGKPSRVRFTTKPDGSKVRVAVKGGGELGVVSPARKK